MAGQLYGACYSWSHGDHFSMAKVLPRWDLPDGTAQDYSLHFDVLTRQNQHNVALTEWLAATSCLPQAE